MSDEQIKLHFQTIRQQFAALQRGETGNWEELNTALENLRTMVGQMQTNLEAVETTEEELLQQNQQLVKRSDRYYDLFQASPVAYLVTDVNGVIVEANQAIGQLLNVAPADLVGVPLISYIAEVDHAAFESKLRQLPESSGVQVWQMVFCPQMGYPLAVKLHVDAVRSDSGVIQELRIAVYRMSQAQQRLTPLTQRQILEEIRLRGRMLMAQIPQSLDGLRVLVVDDDADSREFVAAVLESYGIQVKVVTNAAAALEQLEQFQPDVLLSDIRMPGEDGYNLIRQVRALESLAGRHIPAGAITAYLDEDREKAINAGYEAYLHKLAQPVEWVEMVAQLAEHTPNSNGSLQR